MHVSPFVFAKNKQLNPDMLVLQILRRPTLLRSPQLQTRMLQARRRQVRSFGRGQLAQLGSFTKKYRFQADCIIGLF